MILARKRADRSVEITAPAFGNSATYPLASMALFGLASQMRCAEIGVANHRQEHEMPETLLRLK
jgi:hypothetical protein